MRALQADIVHAVISAVQMQHYSLSKEKFSRRLANLSKKGLLYGCYINKLMHEVVDLEEHLKGRRMR